MGRSFVSYSVALQRVRWGFAGHAQMNSTSGQSKKRYWLSFLTSVLLISTPAAGDERLNGAWFASSIRGQIVVEVDLEIQDMQFRLENRVSMPHFKTGVVRTNTLVVMGIIQPTEGNRLKLITRDWEPKIEDGMAMPKPRDTNHQIIKLTSDDLFLKADDCRPSKDPESCTTHWRRVK